MIRKKIINTGLVLLFLLALFTLMPSKTYAAKTVAKHKIFSETTIQKRIAEIKDYYYNKPKKLTKKNILFDDMDTKIKFTYYLNGKDLLFAYGKGEYKEEYRLYFYKNQLIRLLINEGGKKSKTCNQLYKKLSKNPDSAEYDDELKLYMELESYFRIKYASLFAKQDGTKTIKWIYITDISNTSLTYHTGESYFYETGIVSLDAKAYTAILSKNVKIKSYWNAPLEYELKTVDWLKENFGSRGNYIPASLKEKNGKIVEVSLMYQD